MNEFLKQLASDIKSTNQVLSEKEIYALLKYTKIKRDASLAQEIETFYSRFLNNLSNSLVRHITRQTGKNEFTTHYIGFYVEKRANYTEAYKVYFAVKYEYLISALKTIFSYLIRNSIPSVVKFHVQATNENIVIRFYHKEDVLPFLNYCNNNFILEDLLEEVNPFIATVYKIGVLKDDNTLNSYNGTLANLLYNYLNYLQANDILEKASSIHFLDYVIARKKESDNEIIKFNIQAIEKNITAILNKTSPIE